jgi:hypothetical protein
MNAKKSDHKPYGTKIANGEPVRVEAVPEPKKATPKAETKKSD